jgi:chromosome segregation ATPase
MPPKAAPAAAAAAPAAPELSPEQLVEKFNLTAEAVQLTALKTHEQSSFEAMAAEKAALSLLWAGVKKQVEDARAEARERERARAEAAEEQAHEVQLYKLRLKRLLFEHQADAVEAQTDGRVAMRAAQEAHAGAEHELGADARDLKAVLRDAEVAQDEFLRALKADSDRVTTDARLEFERDTRELQASFEDRLQRLREQLTRAREEDVRGIEGRKSRHIQAVIAAHEKAFADIKLYYNEITHSNLDLIKSLKEEVEDLKKKEAADEKVMFAIAQENKKMSEPMRRALDEVRRLRDAREVYRREIGVLHETKASILVVQDRLENLRWELEILQQRFNRVKAERDALFERFAAALHEVKQKAGFKQLLLEERAASALQQAELQNGMLRGVMAAAHVGGAGGGVGGGGDAAAAQALQAQVAERDGRLAALQAELARVAAEHDRAVRVCLDLMAEKNIPSAELGFRPLSAEEILRERR